MANIRCIFSNERLVTSNPEGYIEEYELKKSLVEIQVVLKLESNQNRNKRKSRTTREKRIVKA